MDDPYTLSSTRARMGGMEAAELAGSATMSNIYDRVQKDYQIDRPRGASSYVPPSFRRQITAEELEMKRANLQTKQAEFEMNRANALMTNEESKLNHQIKVQEQVGPATQALYEIDPASPNAFSEIREVQKTYPLAFEDNAFLQSSVNPLIEVHNRYMEDVPKPKTRNEIIKEIIELNTQRKAILDSAGAKSYKDLVDSGNDVDALLYEQITQEIDALTGAGQPAAGGDGGAVSPFEQMVGTPGIQPTAPGATSDASAGASTMTPKLLDVEENPFLESANKIKQLEISESQAAIEEEAIFITNTAERIRETLIGISKGDASGLETLPSKIRRDIASMDIQGLREMYNLIELEKENINWLKKNPTHPKAKEVTARLKQMLGI